MDRYVYRGICGTEAVEVVASHDAEALARLAEARPGQPVLLLARRQRVVWPTLPVGEEHVA